MEAPATGRIFVYDARTPGLVVAVTPSGKKTFQLYRRDKGVPKHIMLGSYPTLTVEQARERATKILAGILDGQDPNEEERKARAVSAGRRAIISSALRAVLHPRHLG